MWGRNRWTLPDMPLDLALRSQPAVTSALRSVGSVNFWAVRGLSAVPQGQARLAIGMPCSKRQEKVLAQFDFKQVFAGRL